jgi:hypothetical protein
MPGGCKPPALGIREVEEPSAQVLFENAVLFPQVRDHLKLSAIRPSREGDKENPPSNRVEHPPSLLAPRLCDKRAAEYSEAVEMVERATRCPRFDSAPWIRR